MDFTKLRGFMEHLTREKVPGNAINIYLGGQKVFEYASGYSDLEERQEMTGTELLNIYSCTKVATVTAALQLFEKGTFLLSDPLYEYIPEYKEMTVRNTEGKIEKATNPIRIGDLFSMTAGFDYDTNSPAHKKAFEQTGGKMDTLEVIRCMAENPLSFEPGTAWQYSLCHDVLAGLVCAITGMKFRDYVKKYLFEPLDMNESYFHRTAEIKERMATQYSFVEKNGTVDFDIVKAQKSGETTEGIYTKVSKEPHLVLGSEYDSGGGGIVTSIPDYSKLVAALANKGMGLNGNRILSSRTVELLHTDFLTDQNRERFNWPQFAGYGYGLGVRTMIDKARGGSLSSIGEFGWGGAAGATVLADTNLNLAVFYSHHMLNPKEGYYQPRLRNVIYACLDEERRL